VEHDKALEINRKVCVNYMNYSIIPVVSVFFAFRGKVLHKANFSYINASTTGLMQKMPEVIKGRFTLYVTFPFRYRSLSIPSD